MDVASVVLRAKSAGPYDCMACKKSKPSAEYSNSQLQKEAKKCKECAGADAGKQLLGNMKKKAGKKKKKK